MVSNIALFSDLFIFWGPSTAAVNQKMYLQPLELRDPFIQNVSTGLLPQHWRLKYNEMAMMISKFEAHHGIWTRK
jgi:hypothetical protein